MLIRSKVIAALVAVYVFWGATSPAMEVAVQHVPPFVMACVRFFCAGTIMWTWARVRGVRMPSAREWRGAFYSGILLLVLGNAVFAWTLQYIPGGIGSLFFALSPIWNAVIAATFYRERIAGPAIAGIALGLGGMALLLAPGGANPLPLWPALVATATSIVWSVGSMIQRRYAGSDYVQTSAIQMLAACAVLLVVAPLTGERFMPADFVPSALGAIAFLVVFGSIVAYSAYVWLMRTQSTALASTNSYVNPVVSLGIGFAFLGESVSARELAASAIVLGGVALMMLPSRGGAARAAAAAD